LNWSKSNQIKSNQIKSNQIKSNQINSNQIKSNQIKSNQAFREVLLSTIQSQNEITKSKLGFHGSSEINCEKYEEL